MNPIPTVGVLLYQDKKILLVKHGEKAGHPTGSYGVPAGRFEPDETPKQAAIRELFEETGLTTTENNLEELPIHVPPVDLPRKDGTTRRFVITLFLCKKYAGVLRPCDETTPEWIPVAEIGKLNLIGHTKQFVEEGLHYV